MLEKLADSAEITFQKSSDHWSELREVCENSGGISSFIDLGRSEEGRKICGARLGRGEKQVSLIGGSHSDEPAGPETLRVFITEIAKYGTDYSSLLNRFTFFVFPQVNPDGEAKNQSWLKPEPHPGKYLSSAFREPPGRDLEFGYPDLRRENRLLSDFWRKTGPFSLHISFHGMGFSEGVLFLIERHWISRTVELRAAVLRIAEKYDLPLHDHNRKGEKGFYYIGPGFSTTPEASMMRMHFESQGDAKTAALFKLSSMEFIQSLGGDPVCCVTELPLFLLSSPQKEHKPGTPDLYNRFQEEKEQITLELSRDTDNTGPSWEYKDMTIIPLGMRKAVQIQLEILESALKGI